MEIPSNLRPADDYRLWIDGSFKDGYIGYGIVIMPGRKLIYGGREGNNAAEAELLAAEQALAAVPEGVSCAIYCDFLPAVRYLNGMDEALKAGRAVRAQYMNDNDPRHREAHDLANKGRIEASDSRRRQRL